MYAAVGALAAVENVFPPIPADTAVGIGAFLSHKGTITATGIFAVTWSANVASAALVYAAARIWGRAFFRGGLGQRLLPPRHMERIEALYERHGALGVFVSRFVPALRAVVPPFAGIAGLSAGRAVGPVALASALWYGALTWLVASFAQEIEDVARIVAGVNWVGGVAVGIAIAVFAVVMLRRRKVGQGREDL